MGQCLSLKEHKLDDANIYHFFPFVTTGVGRVLASRAKFGEKITVTNGDARAGHIKFDLEIREADQINFQKTYDIFNGASYSGMLLIKNHQQIDKTSNLVI